MDTLARWHDVVRSGDLAGLDDLLDDDVVFHSPVVHRPIEGKALTTMYLAGAFQVLVSAGTFRYVRQVVGEREAVLEFVTDLDGIEINGVDLITWNGDGRIVDFKVMVRPRKGLDELHQRMAKLLAAAEDASSR